MAMQGWHGRKDRIARGGSPTRGGSPSNTLVQYRLACSLFRLRKVTITLCHSQKPRNLSK